jgi:hypothetical protein
LLIDTRGKTRTRIHLEPAQTAMLVPLQGMLAAAGLILVCPQCLSEGGSHLSGDVASDQAVWKLECACTVRVMERKDAVKPFDADGDLIASANTVLNPVKLMVRCPQRACLRHPIEVERGERGVIVRCQCAKTTFRQPLPTLQ